ncbi:unnamed protein product [Closterium sp. NIES-65]|nr:unnamed protein product [Closterium sp. NIES-65]
MPWVMLHLSTSSHPHFRALRFNHTPVEALSAAAGEKGQGSGGEGGGKVGGIVGGSGWGVRKGEVWRPRRGEGVCELGRGDWQMEREGYPLNGRTGFDYLHFAWRESECAHPFTLTHAPLSHPHLQPQENGRTDFDYLHFAWRESDCAHPFTRFRADRFFEAFQNRRIVFVGDSTLLSMFQSLLCLLSVGPSLPPNHSMPTERLNRTFPSLLHPPSSSPSLLSSYSSSPLTSSSSSSSAASPAGSKSQASTPLVFQYTFPHANTSLDFFHSDFLTVLESAPSHAPGQSDTPAPDTPPASMAVPDTPNPSLTKNMPEGINNSSITATNIVASFGSSSNAGIGRSLLTDTSETTQEPGSDGLNAVELGSDRSGAAKPSSEGLGAVRVVRLDAWAAYVVAAQPHVLVIHTGGAWVGLQHRWQEHRARIHASQEGQKGQEGQEGQEGQSAANESKVFAAVAGKGVEGGMREEKVGAEGKVEVGGGKRKAGGGKGEPGGGKGEVGGGNWKAGGGKGEPGGGKGEPGGGKGEVGGGKGKAGGGNGEPGGGKGEVGGGKGKAGGGKGEPGGGTGGNGGGNKGTGEKAKGKGGGKKGNGGEKRGNGGEKKGSGGEKKGSGGENRGNGGENRGNGGENRGNGGENKGNGGGNRGNGGENRGNGGENKGNGRENRGNGGENKGNGGEKKGNGGGKKGNGGGKKGNGGGKKGNGGGKKGNSGGNGVDGKGQGKQGEGKRQKVGEKVEEGVMKQGGDNGGQTASGGGGGDTTSGSQTDPFAGGELRMGDFGDDDAILQGDSNMSILDGMDGADEAGSLGSMDGSDAAEGGSGEAVGGSKLEEGDVRLEEEEQQTGGSFMADEADIVLEEMSEASSSVGRGSFLDEDRPVENDEVPEQQQQQGGSVMADEADQVQEEMSQGRLSEGEVMPSVNQVTFDEEGEAAKEDAVQEKDNESHVVTGAENDKEVRGEDVHNEAANKEDESPGGPSVLPPNLLDSVDFLDPVAAFTKTLRMLHHFLSSQPTAESLPTFFLGLPREHYFRADQGNHTSLCLPDDVTCKENGQCSLFSRPREWLEEGGEEQAHQQRWQRWRWRQERERRERREWVHSSVGQMERVVEREIGMADRVVLLQAGGLTDARVDAHVGSSLPAEMRSGPMGRSRGAGEEDHAPSGGSRPKRRRYATTSWQDAVGGGSSGGGGAGAGGEGAGAAAGGGGGGPGGGGGAGGTGGGARKGVYHCNYCHRDVTGEVRVKCAACVDFDLCAECFSVGAAAHPHSASHPYHVMDTMSFPLVHEDWTADEEMLLLEPTPLPLFPVSLILSPPLPPLSPLSHQPTGAGDALEMHGMGNWGEVVEHVGCGARGLRITLRSFSLPPFFSSLSRASLRASSGAGDALEMYGMGNWGEIAEHVGSKSKTQCHDHYLYDYLLSPTGPLPDLSRLRTQADTEAAKAAMKEQEAAETAARAQEAVLFSVPVVKPEPGTKADDAAAPITSGYNTKRNEFDPEYDNEAEAPLAELEFKDSDSSVDRQLKIKMLHIYYSRLEERSRRKAFILERGLLDPRRVDGTIRPETTTGSRERVRDRDRTDEQHKREDGAEQGGERERGTLGEVGAEAGEGGVEKGEGGGKRGGKRGGGGERRRSKEEREMFLRCRVFARFLSAEEHEGLVQSLTQAQRLRDRVAVLQELRAAGCKSLAEGRRFIQAHYKDNPAAAAAAIACLPPSATAISTASSGGASAALDISSHPGCDLLSPKQTSSLPHNLPSLLPLTHVSTCCPSTCACLPDHDKQRQTLPSAQERELCTHMRLLPAHYLRAKQVILQQAALSGGTISRAAVPPTLPPAPAITDGMFLAFSPYIPPSPIPSPPSEQVILQQAALSGGAISRAAVHRLFRLPPATTDAIFRLLLGASWIAEAGGNSSGGGMGGAMEGGMVKQEGM